MREVSHASFHTALHMPHANVGNIGTTLPSANKSWAKLSMHAAPEGLLVNINGHEAIVPWANVVIAALKPVPAPAKTEAKTEAPKVVTPKVVAPKSE